MNKGKDIFWKNPFEAIVCLVLVLLAIGCINVFSASQVAAQDLFGNSRYYLYRYSLFALIGLAVMVFCSLIDYRVWLGRKADFFIVFTIIMLIYVIFKGTAIKGAQRWIQVAPALSFQPSELAKLSVITLCASHIGKRLEYGRRSNIFSAPCLWAMIMGALVYIQPDLGTAAIIVSLTLSIYFICGLPAGQYLILLLGLPAVAAVLAVQASYRLERVQAWLDPWAYADRTGYQAVQSILAIGSGGWTGTGMGHGSSKFYYLPEAHTDFSFAILCQEWGFLGALAVIALFALLSYTLWKAAALAPDGQGYIIITGANILLTGQAMGNIAMVCGLLPVIGVPLPFISYGGTSLVSNMALFGIVLNIIRQSQRSALAALPVSRGARQRGTD
ncbi:MAG: putative lipid II flippase FtsW [Acidaminococcales bacterium]|jgi:cell division protein FtsW|nr:putative lipid II flippase FtsW [Acidaminococcales bacterium]